MPHCVTCGCSELWGVITHHLCQLVIMAMGTFLGLSLALWLWR